MASIHPSAVIEDGAIIGQDVEIGPFSFIGGQAVLGDGVRLAPRATILGRTTLGEKVQVHSGAVIGGTPQILKAKPEDAGTLTVGARTVLRENVTLHVGSTGGKGETRIGADCLLMANSHFAHDCVLGDRGVIANSVAVAGHCVFGDDVWSGGAAAVHQFTRVGDHAFIGGGSILVADVPPFCMTTGNRAVLDGLNLVGLKRRGFSREDINTLRHLYKDLFLAEGAFAERLARAEDKYASKLAADKLLEFIREGGKRPLCHPA